MKRTLDATFLNKVANDPSVHPWLGFDGEIDLTNVCSNIDNYCFQDDHGGFVVCKNGDGVYEVHTLFLEKGRGARLVDLIGEGMEYMFTRTDCHTLITQLPDDNQPAYLLATTVGFKPLFYRKDTPRGGTTYAKYTLDEWVQNTRDLERDGRWFHDKMHELNLEDHHTPDTAHERAVGAAVRMFRNGNCFKAQEYYNSWAKFAGYPVIHLLCETPTVIDLGAGVIVEMGRDRDMEIIKCPSD